MGKEIIVTNENLEEFLDLITFNNSCCGCSSGAYSMHIEFTATIHCKEVDNA